MVDYIQMTEAEATPVRGKVRALTGSGGIAVEPRQIDSTSDYVLPAALLSDPAYAAKGDFADFLGAYSTVADPTLSDTRLSQSGFHSGPAMGLDTFPAAGSPFLWLDNMQNATNRPDMVATHGFTEVSSIYYENQLGTGSGESYAYVEATAQAFISANPPTGEYVFVDIEAWSTAIRTNVAKYVAAMESIRAHLASSEFDSIRSALGISAFKLGFYSRPPHHVSGAFYSTNPLETRATNRDLEPMARACDFVAPALGYWPGGFTVEQFEWFFRLHVAEARRYHLPVIIYCWNTETDESTLLTSAKAAKLFQLAMTYADGVVIWCKSDQSDWTDAWADNGGAAWFVQMLNAKNGTTGAGELLLPWLWMPVTKAA